MEKISSFQLFGLLILFQIGSYVVFGFASSAKQDAWLVALISTGVGIVLMMLYLRIYRLYPGHDLISILQKCAGKWIGNLVGHLYVLAFVYVGGRVLRDFAELVLAYLLPQTPLMLILIIILFLSFYVLLCGLEVFARLAEMFLMVFLVAFLIQTVLITVSDLFQLQYLLPIAHQKKEILKAVVPLGITVPFGETIAFLMFLHQVRSQRSLGWVFGGAVVLSGIILALINILAIAVLGPSLFARMVYPLLTTLQQVQIGDFLENIDPLAVVYIGISVFFKVTVFLYAAATGVKSIYRLNDYRSTLVPLSLLVLLLAFFMAKSVPEHAMVGLKWVPWLMWIPLFIIIPVLIYGVGRIRQGGKQDAEAQNS